MRNIFSTVGAGDDDHVLVRFAESKTLGVTHRILELLGLRCLVEIGRCKNGVHTTVHLKVTVEAKYAALLALKLIHSLSYSFL